jgi:hypothetical protein
MQYVTDHPLLLLGISFAVLCLSSLIGRSHLRRISPLEEELRHDFGLILGATLTLLGLLIGFSFSMATSRYDQRKNLEADEANAIGTEYLRADALPSPNAAHARDLLREYLDLRIQAYVAKDEQNMREIDDATARLESDMWATVLSPAKAQPTPVTALAVTGMNDVLNSKGYTEAAWRNRIPTAAWALMGTIAIGCNVLVGYGSRGQKTGGKLLPILPFALSIAFMLIADIDAPRHGIIRLRPQNLTSLAQSVRPT